MKHLAVLGFILGLAVVSAHPRAPHELTVAHASLDCTHYCLELKATNLGDGDADHIKYTFTLTSTSGETRTVTGDIDFVAYGSTYTKTICLDWPSGPLTDNFTVTGTATLTTPSDSSIVTIDFGAFGQTGGSSSMLVNCGGSPPSGKSFSFKNSMEGDLAHIRPGDWISGGYSFKFTNTNHGATTYTVTTSITLPVYCPDGGGSGGDILIPLGTQTFDIAARDTDWHRTGDQNSILAWEGAVQAPDMCSGNRMRNQIGATFNATVSQNPQVSLVNWRFHYRDPAAKGKPNTNCTNPLDPNRNRADVCGASWSQTFIDP